MGGNVVCGKSCPIHFYPCLFFIKNVVQYFTDVASVPEDWRYVVTNNPYWGGILSGAATSLPCISLHTAATFSPLRPENVTVSPTAFPLHAANASGGGPGRLLESFEAFALILSMTIAAINVAMDEKVTIRFFFILILRLFLL